jgi:anaerobic magnesium-protoporphyrin IX monomethyl ester cyclase
MATVTILRPPLLVPMWSDSGPLTPPVGPAYLAASLREAGHRPRIVDGIGENPFQVTALFNDKVMALGLRSEEIVERIEPDTDLIGVSCMFSQDWPEIRRLIQMARRRFPGVPIIAGGEHITAAGDFTLNTTPEIDVCVIGEGEETIVDIANALDRGASFESIPGLLVRANAAGAANLLNRSAGGNRSTGPRTRIRDLDTIPRPAWDLVPIDNYLDNGLGYGVDLGRSMPIIATRGCPYQCTFCSNPEMWTTRWYARNPDMVLDEIRAYQDRYGATNFDFYDLTAIVKRSWIIEFTDRIRERNMKFTWQLPSGTRSEAIDEDVCRRLYESGCRNMSYAPESGSPEVLKRIKKVVKLDRLEGSVFSAVRNGLNVKLNIIMGFPNESRKELGQTVRFLARMGRAGVHDMSISLFSPYPGSELYHELRKAGRIPELSDEYFLSLCAYKDFAQSVSYTEGLTPRVLNVYRILGFLTFYGIQYAVRPWRVLRLVRNLVQHKQESRLDKSLQDLARRMKGRRHPVAAVKGARVAG